MKGLRLWALLFGVVSFGAGLASGTLLAESRRGSRGEGGPLADYERLLVERFELEGRRAVLLHQALELYEEEIEERKERRLAPYLSELEKDLRDLGREYNRYIRDRILPPGKRAEFDAMLVAAPFP